MIAHDEVSRVRAADRAEARVGGSPELRAWRDGVSENVRFRMVGSARMRVPDDVIGNLKMSISIASISH